MKKSKIKSIANTKFFLPSSFGPDDPGSNLPDSQISLKPRHQIQTKNFIVTQIAFIQNRNIVNK